MTQYSHAASVARHASGSGDVGLRHANRITSHATARAQGVRASGVEALLWSAYGQAANVVWLGRRWAA